jgi:hypothetical protein
MYVFSFLLLFSFIHPFYITRRGNRRWEEYQPKRANTSAGVAGSRNAGKHWGDHQPGWGRRAGQRRQYLGSANDDDGTGCAERWGPTTSVDETNDNGELPPVRDIHQQGPSTTTRSHCQSNDRGQPPAATTSSQCQRKATISANAPPLTQ